MSNHNHRREFDSNGNFSEAVTPSGAATGGGPVIAVPAPSGNGTPLTGMPTWARGVRFYLAAGETVTYGILTSAPAGAIDPVVNLAGGTDGDTWFDEPIAADQVIYITDAGGSPRYRFVR